MTTAYRTGVLLAKALLEMQRNGDAFANEALHEAGLYLEPNDREANDALKAIIEYYKA